MSLRRGMFVSGVLLFARALARDPTFVLEPPFRRAISKLALKLTRRLGLTNSVETATLKFSDASMNPDTFAAPQVPTFSRRRVAFVESIVEMALAGQPGRS